MSMTNEDFLKLDVSEYREELGTSLKDYINRSEKNDVFMFIVVNLAAEVFMKRQGQNGSITKEEHRNLSMATTYMKKFIDAYLGRMDRKSQDQIAKMIAQGYSLRILDNMQLRRLQGDWAKKFQAVHMPREEFLDFADYAISVHCNGCQKNHGQCDFYNVLRDNSVPEFDPENKSCPYAMELDNEILAKKVELEAIAEGRRKEIKSKRRKK